jgi:hypothetical protein
MRTVVWECFAQQYAKDDDGRLNTLLVKSKMYQAEPIDAASKSVNYLIIASGWCFMVGPSRSQLFLTSKM